MHSRARAPRRLMMTSFGWNDPGGGTTVPRLVAKELVARGWDVTVFHAAVKLTAGRTPYELVEQEDEGVRLIGVHNRPHGLFDMGNPLRELDDPPITAQFAAALDALRPEVVHFHNLHNLGAALIDQVQVRGLPSYFSTHNYWLICPRAYLLTGQMTICPGPGDGERCAPCVGSHDLLAHRRRLGEIRARAHAGLDRILAVSDAVREALLGLGYDPSLVDVVRQAMPHESEIWNQTGRDRAPGRLRSRLTVAFLGSAYPHKGPQLLVEAAQRTAAELEVRIIGEVRPEFSEQLHRLDARGVMQIHGAFDPQELGSLLADVDVAVLPSMWWDCAPLAAAECLAARTPLVVPRLGGLAEAVTDGVDGLMFDALDADDLARQLDRLAGETGLLERLQGHIAEPRSFAEYVDELEDYYAGGRAPASVQSDTPRTAASIAVRWKGDHGLPTSLSIINDRITERLTGPLQRVRADGTPVDPPLAHPAAVEVRQQWPPDLSVPGSGRLAAIIPWEFGSIPERWLPEIARAVDELWVPSEFVRGMYVEDGVQAERVHVIPNGVDLEVFAPATSPPNRAEDATATRFLFVGGLIWRKGPDVLLEAFRRAFGGREDVELVVKDFGADSLYRDGLREPFNAHIASGALPKLTLISESLSTAEIVALYRSCDVLVHPYRGEGFAMPVLEAMACGLPVITTAGGPTDEFCPPEVAWRIRSVRQSMPANRFGELTPASTPWTLEPDVDHLVELLHTAHTDREERRLRGRAARTAAEALSWDAAATLYQQRISELAAAPPKLALAPAEPFPLTGDAQLRVLATPAWRADDELAALLRLWQEQTTPQTSACLYLLADPSVAGTPEEIEGHVLDAARHAGVGLDDCADIDVLIEPLQAGRDERLHASVDAYVALHDGCAGHIRYARAAGTPIMEPGDDELTELLRSIPQTRSDNDR